MFYASYKSPTSEPANKPTIERSIRKIIGSEPINKVGHMPKIEFAEQGDVTHISFYYEKDYKKFCKLLNYTKYSYKFTTSEKEQIFEESEKYKCKDRPIKVKQHTVCMDINQFNKFTKNVLRIEVTSALYDIQCKNQEQNLNNGII
ncbi:hypothetical protein [Wolbachia endosymbiont of Chironomus riparius]|uniref:hypothetical protein n=1 Tax=Wolbachia endosymbiont of Chironomus riparius TaxID=2883238 RepID=UPI00209CE303|nr:hypothetical protein [Wolbachia endosymbiont of Chironomus riparius]